MHDWLSEIWQRRSSGRGIAVMIVWDSKLIKSPSVKRLDRDEHGRNEYGWLLHFKKVVEEKEET